ncbi:MAG: UDP-N-acetylmuramate--L-alanine ligase [Deltaproteobacteria bacterium]|nr:UDP-N-acetylmuramate--L-alanine ligase [Deltaproteobacteria bacterium]
MYKKDQHIHFVGIGGIGMSGIAELLLNLGYKVSGSDVKQTKITARLEELGGIIRYQHQGDNVVGADVVVVSSAIRSENPEIIAARTLKIPVIPRAEMLAELMRMKYGIAVAGAHGKTTTTSMLATVLAQAGLDPTVVIGGRLNSLGTNAKLGSSDFLVAEADESDGSFMTLSPVITVVTNIDREHLPHYGTLENIKATFATFMNKVPFYGLCVLCLDDPNLQDLIPLINKRFWTYGLTSQADIQARDVRAEGLISSYKVLAHGHELGRVSINAPGRHNVYNSLAVVAVGLELDIPFAKIKEGLELFDGVERRFQLIHDTADITIMDDYGHHPTEIRATLEAVKQCFPEKRSVVVFQPHRYTRTRDVLTEFTTAFNQADVLLLLDIYSAGEEPIAGISAERLAAQIREYGHRMVHYMPNKTAALNWILEHRRPGDLILTLGAGDVYNVVYSLVDQLG